ncbi:MAG: hypothetical protein HW421_3063 [Ignavibacteria bacterium]|nr:hypothetical protein [Ignavibacteria bacterium]
MKTSQTKFFIMSFFVIFTILTISVYSKQGNDNRANSRLTVPTGMTVSKIQTPQFLNKILQDIYPNNLNLVGSDKNGNKLLGANPDGTSLGSCWYDQQTTASMPRRVTMYKPDANAAVFNVASVGTQSGSVGRGQFGSNGTYASLGTYFNFLDGTTTPPSPEGPWVRAEKRIAVPGSIVQKSDGSVFTISHSCATMVSAQGRRLTLSGPMNLSKNQAFVNTFTTDSIVTPDGYFPRLAIDGSSNLHLIFNHRNPTSTNFNNIGYMRSTDGGNTWSQELVMTGVNAFDITAQGQYSAAGHDAYTIDANGSNVVIAWIDRNLNFAYRKSTDKGENWDTPNYVFYNGSLDTVLYPNSTTYKGHSDTVPSAGLHIDAILDDNGNIHTVCNIINVVRTGDVDLDDNSEWYFVPGQDTIKGVGYYFRWGFNYKYIPASTTEQSVYHAAGTPAGIGLAYPKQGTIGHYYPFPNTDRNLDDSAKCFAGYAVGYPQLSFGEDGFLYFVYTSVMDSLNPNADADEVLFTATNDPTRQYYFFNRHIFVTRMDMTTFTWSEPYNITPIGYDCAYPSVSKKSPMINGEIKIPIIYQYDKNPFNWITFNRFVSNMTDEPKIMFNLFPFKAWTAGVETLNDNASNNTLEIVPNPATDASKINFSITKPGDVSIGIFNLLGQQVASLANETLATGSYSIPLQIENLNQGTYFITLKSGSVAITKPMQVIK